MRVCNLKMNQRQHVFSLVIDQYLQIQQVSSFSEVCSTLTVAADRRKLRTHVVVRRNQRHDGYNHRNLLVITQQHIAHKQWCTQLHTTKDS
jgi:hypothetical protein